MRQYLFILVLLAASTHAIATSLPPPSRTVYKCEVAGKVHYADSPCVGAQKVDVTPTRGMNKSTGRELSGADVRRELQHEQFSEAVRPLTGMNAQQLDQAGRRMKLSAEAQVACRCQWSSNNPHLWHLNFPHPSHARSIRWSRNSNA